MPGLLFVMEDEIAMHRKALEIAEEHFRRVNPSMWDGSGECPAVFHNAVLHTLSTGTRNWMSALSRIQLTAGGTVASCGIP